MPKKTESPLNLSKLIFDLIEEKGVENAAVYFSKTKSTIEKWKGGTGIPDVSAAQKVLDAAIAAGIFELPEPAAEEAQPPKQGQTKLPNVVPPPKGKKTTTTDGNPSEELHAPEMVTLVQAAKKFNILMPTNRPLNPKVALSLLGNWKATLPPQVREALAKLDIEEDTLIHRARNILATRFLASGNEWSFWMDSDVLAPMGNAAWFRRRTGAPFKDEFMNYAAIERLTARNKTLVGAMYCERGNARRPINQLGMAAKSKAEENLIAKLKAEGPQDKLQQVDWLGFGCVAVHRKVFEDILKSQPEVKAAKEGEPHGFFTAMENGPQGEDVAFCARALKAGHPAFLDLSVVCAHIGNYAFLP